jgi:hypothetical protein
VRDNDNIILENLYKSVVINENVNLDPWVEWFSKKEISNLPVSWSNVETDGGGMSYGGNVTFDHIMKNAKTNYSNYPDETLKKLSSELQDYVIGLQEDKKVIDQNTASGLISMFQDINNVKYFLDRYQNNNTPEQIPQDSEELQSQKYTSDDIKNMLIRMKQEEGLPVDGTQDPVEQERIRKKLEGIRRYSF